MKRYFDGYFGYLVGIQFSEQRGLIAENFIPSLVEEPRRYQFEIGVVNITHKHVLLYTENIS